MTLRLLRLSDRAPAGELTAAFDAIRQEYQVPGEFPEPALQEARRAASLVQAAPQPEQGHADLRDLPFFTIDPAGSMDLDQAMCLSREGDGYRVRYAIAEVPAFVEPGGALDAATRERVETYYLPDGRVPLHPPVLGEDAASLLPDVDRRAYVWDMALDAAGELRDASLEPAVIRSRRRLDYAGAQAQLDSGTADEQLVLLSQVGPLRLEAERRRGGASLPMPEQEVERAGDGYALTFRPAAPLEDWNAQVSLMTGMVAARMMLDAGIGILRTMPRPEAEAVEQFRRQAAALGATWPSEMPYGEFLRTLDRDDPRHLALVHEATGLFRGAAYTAFDGAPPEQPEHAAVAAPYAHVTAPLRRLVDRFGLACCASLSAGRSVPTWVREALPQLPDLMREGDRRASAVDRACTDAVEAAVLSPSVGRAFPAVVVGDRGEKGVTVQVTEPAVLASASGRAEPGERVQVRLVEADVAARRVRFEVSPSQGG